MSGIYLKQSTASQSRALGPFLDDTDFKTAETGLTIANTDIKLVVNGGASANKNSGGGTHRVNGVYGITFDATDTATVGEMEVSVVVAGALPVFHKFFVLEEAIYDQLFGASALGYIANAPVNVAQFGGSNGTFASGRPEVNASHFGGTAGTFASGRPEVNTTHVGGTIQTTGQDIVANITTLLGRITSALFSGITSMAQWLGALAGKQTANSTARTEIRATGAGSGTYDETTDSLEGFHDGTATASQVAAAVTAAIQIKKNVALSNFMFTMYTTGTRTPATGKTITCTRCLDSASSFTAMANSASEIGSSGTYRISLTTSETNCNTATWKFEATGCDPLIMHIVTQS